MNKSDVESLLDFPCQYQFKAMGNAGEEFKTAVVGAIKKYVSISEDSVRSLPSKKGTYQSVSVFVTLYNYQQLTDIYAEIRRIDDLKMLL